MIIAENVLDRDVEADRPNHKWLDDLTRFRTGEGLRFVAGVPDPFVRCASGWDITADRHAAPAMDAPVMAGRRRRSAKEPLDHSDTGSRSGSAPVTRHVADTSTACSKRSSGPVWDNPVTEGFLPLPNTERTARMVWRTRDADRANLWHQDPLLFSGQRDSLLVKRAETRLISSG